MLLGQAVPRQVAPCCAEAATHTAAAGVDHRRTRRFRLLQAAAPGESEIDRWRDKRRSKLTRLQLPQGAAGVYHPLNIFSFTCTAVGSAMLYISVLQSTGAWRGRTSGW